MTHNWNILAGLPALGAFCSLVVWLGTTNAEESSVLVNKTAVETQDGPALPPPRNPNAEADDANGAVGAPQESVTVTPEQLPTPPQASQPRSNSQSRSATTTAKKPF